MNEKVVLPDAQFELRATVEHRGALVTRSTTGPLSADVGNTDPAYRKEGPLGVALETFESRVARAVALDDSEEGGRAPPTSSTSSPRSRRACWRPRR